MNAESGIILPASGLAEDILAQFTEQAHMELDNSCLATVKSADTALFHLVTFNMGKEEYGVDIGSVQEIIRATDITPVPGAASHVRGVINLRGKIIPVIDLRTRFNLPQIAASAAQRIMVIELQSRRIGILVDSVSQVLKMSAGVVEEMPEEAVSIDENFIKGVGKLDGRLIVILDLNRTLLLI
jgi:purine-binding chemotaxis protein CheW